jgi:hypothetical protein
MVSCRTRPVAVIAVLAMAAILGCSRSSSGIKETAVPVKGRVTNAGQPLKISNPMVGWVEVAFIEVKGDGRPDRAGETFTTHADENGAFVMAGRLGNGLTPGKYRIAVHQWDPFPQTDKLGGKFGEKRTKIVREVTGKEEILIDVSRPEGT